MTDIERAEIDCLCRLYQEAFAAGKTNEARICLDYFKLRWKERMDEEIQADSDRRRPTLADPLS